MLQELEVRMMNCRYGAEIDINVESSNIMLRDVLGVSNINQ